MKIDNIICFRKAAFFFLRFYGLIFIWIFFPYFNISCGRFSMRNSIRLLNDFILMVLRDVEKRNSFIYCRMDGNKLFKNFFHLYLKGYAFLPVRNQVWNTKFSTCCRLSFFQHFLENEIIVQYSFSDIIVNYKTVFHQ